MYTVREISAGLSDDQWKEFYDFLYRVGIMQNTLLTVSRWEDLKLERLNPKEIEGKHERLIYSEGKLTGRVRTVRRGERVDAVMDTVLDPVPAEFLDIMLHELSGIMEEAGYKSTILRINHPALKDLSERAGGRMLNHFLNYKLTRDEINIDKLQQWRLTASASNPAIKLHYFSGLPGQHLHEYAALFVDLLHDMPRDPKLPPQPPFTVERIIEQYERDSIYNRVQHTVIAFDREEMIGHTTLGIFLKEPGTGMQFMTGVKKQYRGRGIAKWLKAEMLLNVIEKVPQLHTIDTSTYSLNLPMQGLNFAIGYKLRDEGYEYELFRDPVRSYLGKNNRRVNRGG